MGFADEEIDRTKLKDMDEFLKYDLVKFWFECARHKLNYQYQQAFEGYSTIFDMLRGYDFENKVEISELIDDIQTHLYSLGGKATDVRAVIEHNKNKVMFKELVNKLSSLLPKAFADLNLWFRNVIVNDDLDIRYSEENFGTKKTLVKEKGLALSNLKTVELIELLTKNSVHDAYAKALMKGAVKNVL